MSELLFYEPLLEREIEEDEKILVPLFNIDNENQILGMREAIFFAKQLNRTDFK